MVILGILAAIVIPQFTDASDEAMDANIRTQLQTIRSQIQLHNVQNPAQMYDDTYVADGTNAFWFNLVNGEYLQQNPRNPRSPAGEAQLVGAATGAFGWVWDQANEDLLATDGLGVFRSSPSNFGQ